MKTIEYHAIEGEPIPDGLAMERADQFLKSEVEIIKVSSEAFILAVRVLIREGYYQHDQVQIRFGEMIIPIDRDGRMEHPRGFCDYILDSLARLF